MSRAAAARRALALGAALLAFGAASPRGAGAASSDAGPAGAGVSVAPPSSASAAASAAGAAPPADGSDAVAMGAARSLAYEGLAAYRAGDYATAEERMRRAYALVRAPSVGLYLARSLERLGRLVEAAELYLEVTRLEVAQGDEALQREAQRAASDERAALLPRIPTLRVVTAAAEPLGLSVDGRALPLELLDTAIPLDPGEHVVALRAATGEARATVTLAERAAEELTLDPAEAPGGAPGAREPAPPIAKAEPAASDEAPRRGALFWSGVATLGAGGVALAVGATTGAMALGAKQSLESDPACDAAARTCTEEAYGAVDEYDALRASSTVAFVLGGALAVTGGALLIIDGRRRQGEAPRAALVVGPTGVGLRGRF